MREKAIKVFDFMVYWSIILLPFSIAISKAPMNVFMGMAIVFFILKKTFKKEKLFVKTDINIPLLLLFIITCFSIFRTISLHDTLKGGILRLLQYIFIFFVMADQIKDKKHMLRIIIASAFGLALASSDAIWQVIFGKDFVRGYEPVVNIGIVRATASFKDSNVFGTYLSALAPLVLGVSFYYFKGVKKIVFTVIALLSLIGIFLTYSRPTLLAIYVVLFFFSFARKNKAFILALIIFTLVSPFIMPKTVKDWAKEVDYNPARFMCNDDRIAIYLNTLNMIKAHPVLGVGANTFMKNYKQYKNNPEYRNVVTADLLYAHNNFLHMAAEIGLTGLIIFLWLLFKLFSASFLIYRNSKDDFIRILCLSLSACLISFLINGLTESSLYSSTVAILFWFVAGFVLSLKRFIHAN